jgi:hypothetical protein
VHEAVVVEPEVGEMVQIVCPAVPNCVPVTTALSPESHVGGPCPLVLAWYVLESCLYELQLLVFPPVVWVKEQAALEYQRVFAGGLVAACGIVTARL